MHTDQLVTHLERDLSRSGVLSELRDIINNRESTAGTDPEEVFTREFLCPSIARFFYKEARDPTLSESEIESGLGTEGFSHAPGFGFTPARKQTHLFTKSEFVHPDVPHSWTDLDRPTSKQACPDFAIRSPLPLSVVGEVKYSRTEDPSSAVKELYEAARQAVFYLGVYGKEYDEALIVIADSSEQQAFVEGLDIVNPEIMSRFGQETRVHLATIPLR